MSLVSSAHAPSRMAPRPFRAESLPVPSSLAPYICFLMQMTLGDWPLTWLRALPNTHFTLMLLSDGLGTQCSTREPWARSEVKLAGFCDQAVHIPSAGGRTVLYAGLTPLGGLQLLRARAWEGRPLCATLEDELVDEAMTRSLRHTLLRPTTLMSPFRSWGHWLERRFLDTRSPLSRPARRVAEAAVSLGTDAGQSLNELAAKVCVTPRQLERDFTRYLNISPKSYAKVVRVQGVAEQAMAGHRWADIACAQGYADQAHLCRSVKSVTGQTPGALMASLRQPLSLAMWRRSRSVMYL